MLVVRREAWEATIAVKPPTSYFQGYIMSFIYGKAAVVFGNWSYLNTAAVGCRTGNDSWWENGQYLERLEVVVLGGVALFKELFPEDPAAQRQLNRHNCRHFVGAGIRGAIGFDAPLRFRILAGSLCWGHYKSFPEFYTRILPSLLMPRWVLLAIRRHRNPGTGSCSSGAVPPELRGPNTVRPPVSSRSPTSPLP